MPSKKQANESLSSILDLLVAKAPAMREAGILNLSIDGLSIVLAEAAPEPVKPDKHDTSPPAPVDPFDDPATYGRSRLPGFTRPKEQ